MLEKRFEKGGYEVLLTEDDYQTRKILPQQHIDVLLTDLMTPETIGAFEILYIANHLNADVEVILTTAPLVY